MECQVCNWVCKLRTVALPKGKTLGHYKLTNYFLKSLIIDGIT